MSSSTLTTPPSTHAAPSTPRHGRSAPPPVQPGQGMSHRQILEALSGLLLGMFVAILSSTVVSNALPTILAQLHGGESAYTWVVTATLLATTVTTPIWGKLSDLFSKKLLVQLALVIFVASSAVAGLSQTPGMLIACRVFQGIGAGGLTALAQVVMAAMIAPRERGRYSGYLGATFALATVGGPLIGGVLVDTSWLGWRWCFYVGVPFAAAAIIVLQKTLHLPTIKREAKIDYWGATLLTAGVSLLLVWVSLAGHQFDWMSWETAVMVGGSILLLVVTVIVETWVAEPIIPIRLFRDRTVSVATIASLFVGVALFGATVFMSQYFQISRGVSPTKSGLMTLPLILGLVVSSTIVGQLISRTGRWKRFLVIGGFLLTAGFVLMTTLRADTPYLQVAVFMAMIGLGVGMMMQNLVLAVQNTVDPRDLGAGSSVVAFFRSLGGAVGVSALGAVLSNRVTHFVETGLAGIGVHGGTGQGSAVPDLATLPAPIRAVVQTAYGHATGNIFLAAAPFALLSFIAVLFIKEVPLRQSSGTEQVASAVAAADPVPDVDVALTEAEPTADAAPTTSVAEPVPVVVGRHRRPK
jgi:EmrB/QacA subfamily drug resistance transporter